MSGEAVKREDRVELDRVSGDAGLTVEEVEEGDPGDDHSSADADSGARLASSADVASWWPAACSPERAPR